jgi:hypothetical protein
MAELQRLERVCKDGRHAVETQFGKWGNISLVASRLLWSAVAAPLGLAFGTVVRAERRPRCWQGSHSPSALILPKHGVAAAILPK